MTPFYTKPAFCKSCQCETAYHIAQPGRGMLEVCLWIIGLGLLIIFPPLGIIGCLIALTYSMGRALGLARTCEHCGSRALRKLEK